MKSLDAVIKDLISWRHTGGPQLTLLAVCPNSAAVLEAAVKAAAENQLPMLFAATLNQVDRDGGYTGWTQAEFVRAMRAYARQYQCESPLYPCLDHGGPWLKDRHTLDRLPYAATMQAVKLSLTACLEAGYQLLHIDPTVDRTLPRRCRWLRWWRARWS
jgi:tagatose-1,6-bisphosphate aldolase non-catalytic subunit AgaZ/GatZ